MNSENNQKQDNKDEQANQTSNAQTDKKEIDEETKKKREEALKKAIFSVEDRASELQSEKMERCLIF